MVDWKAGTLDIFRDTTPLSTTSGIFSDIRPEVYEDMFSSFGLDFERPKAFDIFRDPIPEHLLYEMSGRDHSRPTTSEEDMKAFIPILGIQRCFSQNEFQQITRTLRI